MRPIRFLGTALLFGMLVIPAIAASAGESAPRFGITAFAGYGSYAMADVNDLVDGTNEVFRETGLQMDALNGGLNLGIGMEMQVLPAIALALDYERLSGSAKIGEAGASIEYRIPVNSFGATLKGYFLASGPIRIGLGGGLGYYKSAAKAKFSIAGQDALSEDWSGSAIGFHGLGLLDCRASSRISLGFQAGYRQVQIKDVDTVLPSVMGLQGSKLALDWSGLMTRLGITFYLTPDR